MSRKAIRKLQCSNVGQYTITVPTAIAAGKGWKHGTLLEFKFGSKGEVILDEAKDY